MKSKCNKILFFVIMIINIILISCFLCFKKESFSEEENRYLAKFKINEVDEYIKDHFPFRNGFIKFKNNLLKSINKKYINDVYLGKDDYLISIFKNSDKKELIINAINNFVSLNKNVDVMIVPDSILINDDKIDINISDDEEKEIKFLYSKLNSNNINVIDVLKNKNKEMNLYYKTDHHWNTFGAYEAYKYYYSCKNKKYLELDNDDFKVVSEEFLGTSSSSVYGISKKEKIYIYDDNYNIDVNYVIENKKENSLYNFDYLNKKDKYAMFLDNNHALIKITNNDIDSNDSIIVIKNSYANSFIPFLVNDYKNIYIIDLRYFGNNVTDYISENNINDILILYNLNNLYSDMSIVKLK